LDSRLEGYLLGASGGVTGLLGGLIRFGFRTREQAIADPLGFLPLRHERVLTIAAVVIALEVLMGGLASKIGLAPANVGWEAHVGGFLFGLCAFPLFARLAIPPTRP
ncbi:MAG: rhomboid family intramembrane serine protease, partial [Parvularculaceae bacterium]|nr:rhomboid family intramembrane serine protease [Parvularculaceae bacterium]